MSALKFLGKKSWHTATVKNVERVWIAEQRKADEDKKLEEIRRQLQEEQQVEQLRSLHAQHSGRERAPRLDWMYEAPVASQPSAEDYLLGKKYEDTTAESDVMKLHSGEAIGSIQLQGPADPVKDAAAKVRDDPMFSIKKQQAEAMKKILNNPVKMRALREMIKATGKSHKKKKKEKKERKERKERGKEKEERGEERRRDPDRTYGLVIPSEYERREHSTDDGHHHRDRERDEDRDRDRRRDEGRDRRRDEDRDRDRRRDEDRDRDRRRDKDRDRRRDEDRDRDRRRDEDRNRDREKEKDRSKRPHSPSPPRHFQQRRRDRPIRMSEEERERRLREMMTDAEVHEEQRWKRVQRDRQRDEEEKNKMGEDNQDASFLSSMKKEVYDTGGITMAERLRRGVHTLQRGAGVMETRAFKKYDE